MPIKIEKQPIAKLNLDGTTEGIGKKQPIQVDIGIPIDQLHKEVISLASKGIPIEKVIKAVEKDSRITDKAKAGSIIKGVYDIITSAKPKNKV